MSRMGTIYWGAKAVNKKANTLPIDLYKELRMNLKKYDKEFLYETSVDT